MTRPHAFRQLAAPILALLLLTGCTGAPAASDEASSLPTENQPAPSATAELRGDRAVVNRVIDGDTIDVQLDGDIVRVRLLNIDTPETKDPNEIVECLGPEATAYLEQLLAPGTPVGLEYDEEIHDSYGRTLAGVFLQDGRLVNAEIARQGLGTPLLIEPNDRFLPPVEEAFAQAKTDKVGLLDPAVGCALPSRIQEATDALENASPEDLADAGTEAAAAAAFLASLDEIDGDTHPHIRHLLKERSISSGVAEIRSSVAQLEKRAARQQKSRAGTGDGAPGSSHSERSAPQAPNAPNPPQAPEGPAAPPAPAPPVAPKVPPAPKAPAPAPVIPDPPAAPAPPAPAPPAPKPQPQPAPNVVDQAPPGYVTDLPGYTGPRCYAPGGKVFKPC